MSIDKYIGSAGGQPRLIIPQIDKIQDPAVRDAMQAIYRWANALLYTTPSPSSGLLAFASYSERIVPGTNPITWSTKLAGGTYDYLDLNAQYIVQLPPNAITLILYGLEYASGSPPADPAFYLQLNGGPASTIPIQMVLAPTSSGQWGATGFSIALFDDDVAAPSLPCWFSSSASGNVTANGLLTMSSWSKP
jgi:hypothetical protein